MSQLIDVQSGEVKCCRHDSQIMSLALGSCIAVIGYCSTRLIGGIAHVMLPGRAPDKNSENRFRYAEDAISKLFDTFSSYGISQSEIQVCIAGGGNVLKRPDDTICQQNINSVSVILSKLNFPILAQSVGGTCRRRVRLDVKNGILYYAEGDEREHVLFNFFGKKDSRFF